MKSQATYVTRAAVYEAGGTVSVRDFSIPEPGPGQLLVRVQACGLCASEVMAWYADGKAPFVLGHEPVTVVVAAGDQARPAEGEPFIAGERVFVHHHAPCMSCRRCQRGDYVQCRTWRSTKLNPGALSQLAIVPIESVRNDVLRVPGHICDEVATLIEPLATVCKSVRRSQMHAGDRVLVIGLGAMGMMHLLVARKGGASQVLGADLVQARLDRASQFGADAALNADASLAERVHALTDGGGAEIVFVTPGSRSALDAAVSCVAPGGCIVMFTPPRPGDLWPLDAGDLFFKDVSVVTTYSAGPDDTRAAMTLLGDGLPVQPLFTHRFGLDEAAQAYAMVKNAQAALKVVVYPQESRLAS